MDVIEILDDETYGANEDAQSIQVSFEKVLLKSQLKINQILLCRFYIMILLVVIMKV